MAVVGPVEEEFNEVEETTEGDEGPMAGVLAVPPATDAFAVASPDAMTGEEVAAPCCTTCAASWAIR
ncbi:MAG TPA: hypothetical protein VGG56_10270 [Terracidiphilus sp.]